MAFNRLAALLLILGTASAAPLPERKTETPLGAGKDAKKHLTGADYNALLDHTAGWVSVKSHGAKGDGTTDDTAAIQAAINAANTGSIPKAVVLPAGTYVITSLSVAYNKFRIMGVGGFAILQTSANADALTITGGSGQLDSIHLFRAGGAGKGLVLTGGATVGGAGAENKFKRLRISGSGWTSGIEMDNAYLTTFDSIYVTGAQVGLKDLGVSQATDLIGSNLYKNGVNVEWNSRGLTVVGGAIEQASVQEVQLGVSGAFASIASFLGTHFEHDSGAGSSDPMILVGPPGATSLSFASIDRCTFWGNNSTRTAIQIDGGGAFVQGAYFQDFKTGGTPTIVAGEFARAVTLFPNLWHGSVNATHKSLHASAQVSDFDFADGARLRVGSGANQYFFASGANSTATNGDFIAGGNIQATGRLTSGILAPAYGVAVAINTNTKDTFDVVATDGVPFAIMNPVNAISGQRITIRIKNTSGGALGAVTWQSAYKLAGAWVNPADGHSRSITFLYDSTGAAAEMYRSAADVPN
jgi:hypothetical protein